MRQFVVYANLGSSRKLYPMLLNIQSDLIAETETRLAVPLFPLQRGRNPAIAKLSPVIAVNGADYTLMMPLMAGVATNQLGKAVADLSHERATILGALDLLISGI
ncbi:MAG: CcdB family protein [Pseudomonadales bacterium]|jgi:toxin CcdB|nr:CcdB family protein [Pseudomonadales bacterium]